MKRSDIIKLAFLLFITIALSGSAAAQSKDRDHPTPLKSNELTGDLDNSGNEYFYSFIAGPGELTLTVDVKSSDGRAYLILNYSTEKPLPRLSAARMHKLTVVVRVDGRQRA
jgi:hypothetical protein